MKIVILTHSSESAQIKKDTKVFVDFIEKKGHKAEIISTEPKKKMAESDLQEFTISISNEIKNADAVIITPNITNIELGGCISLCMQHRKTTLVYYERVKPESILFASSNLVKMVKYSEKIGADLETVMKPFFTDIKKKKLLYRFNLMLSREMNVFLSHRSREHGVSKADYVRQLIFKDMGVAEE